MFSSIFKKEVSPRVAPASLDTALTVAGQGGPNSADDFRLQRLQLKTFDSKRAPMNILMKYERNQVTITHDARCHMFLGAIVFL